MRMGEGAFIKCTAGVALEQAYGFVLDMHLRDFSTLNFLSIIF